MYNTFVLNFDPLMVDPTPVRLLEFIRSNGYTYQYLTPFIGTIMIKSTANLGQMISSFQPFLRPNSFMLTHVSPTHMSGLLNPAYWEWVNAPAPPPLLSSS
jgi:hypothetical protein